MEILPRLRQSQDWRTDVPRQQVKGNEFADRKVARDDQFRAHIQDRRGNQLADELNGLARRIAQAEHAETRRHIGGQLLLPALLHLGFDRHRLERLDGGYALDQKCLVLRSAREFVVELSAKEGRRSHRYGDVDGKRDARTIHVNSGE